MRRIIMSNPAKFISYKDFLHNSTRPTVRPSIWKGSDIKKHLKESLLSKDLGEGRGAISLVNEDTGSANGVSPNINAVVQVLGPNERNNPHKHSNMAMFIVFEGQGYSIIDGEKIEWEKGDVFYYPAWLSHEHCNTSDHENAVLYTIQDVPTVSRMGTWYLEEPVGTKVQHVVQEKVTDKETIVPKQ